MYLRQGERHTPVPLLAALLLLSLFFTACNDTPPNKLPPLPTLTAGPGWNIVLQTHGNATNPAEEKSQSFSLGLLPAGAYLRLSIACTGQGAAGIQIQVPEMATATPTCTDTPQTVISISHVETSQAHLTANLTMHGTVDWAVLIEERS